MAKPTKLADLVPTSIDAAELAQLVSARLVAIHRDSITSGARADGTGRQPAGGRANSAYEAPEGTPGAAWQGWGTALKPAHEPIVLARRPLVGTIAANVLRYSNAGIHVDACRIESEDIRRWPANLMLDQLAAAQLDKQAGAPGPSRFFYVAKVSTSEREAGLEAFRKARAGELTGGRKEGSAGLKSPRAGAGRTSKGRANGHPTIKPIALMRWLVRLVTPPGGTVLDPFMGSGSTGCAAALEGMDFIGCELSSEYVRIAEARIAHWGSRGREGAYRVCRR